MKRVVEKIRKNLNNAYFIRDLQRLTIAYMILGFFWYILIDPYVWNIIRFIFIPAILFYAFTVQQLKKLNRLDLDFFASFRVEEMREGEKDE